MGWRAAARALLAALPLAAAAHPHGRLDCRAQLRVAPEGLTAVALQLAMDPASSAALAPRLEIGADGQAGASREARRFAELVAGLLRQGGWMLALKPLGADGEPQGPAVDLDDRSPPQFQRDGAGRLLVSVLLTPLAPVPVPAQGWQLACLDTSWYWATGFATPADLSAGPGCHTALEPMRSNAEQAARLQSAARQAGLDGADTVADGMLSDPSVRAPAGTVRCPAP